MKSILFYVKLSNVLIVSLFLVTSFSYGTSEGPEVSIITDKAPGVSVSHGITKLTDALQAKDIPFEKVGSIDEARGKLVILTGLSSGEGAAAQMLKAESRTVPQVPEALTIWKTDWQKKPVWVISGFDEVGLMYGLLDVARRISLSRNAKDPFEHIEDVTEKPYVKERAVSAITAHRRYFEERLHDTQHWEQYFDMMAENRLNQFLLIFGYKNNQYIGPNFTAPVYPNFFDLEEYPYVKLLDISPEQQQKNTASLKKIIALAHERGIEFGVGLWDQIERDERYSAIVRDDTEAPAELPANLIWGLTQNNLIPYTQLAMRKFFRTFPGIDLVQFRMHWESGITGEVALKFWKEVFQMLKEERPDLKIEARAKDTPDETFYDGTATGMDFRVATKHWMEQMGMPFHPTRINRQDQFNRRHGYADLLRYPKEYGFKWRLWNGGTTRILLWGDPDWVKIFAEGSHLYDAVGYEFNEPLYFKMNGSPHDAEVFELLNPNYRYYTYEFERYWYFYQLFGRIGYNPNTPSKTWEMEFQARFGKETGIHLMKGLNLASKVLPRIVSASYLYSRFPSPQGWAEMQSMEDLPHYAENSEPSDVQQFASPMEEAVLILTNGSSVKRLPSQTSDWFLKTSLGILEYVERAEQSIDNNRNNEYTSTITDLKILAYLSMYHSRRLLAAVKYNLYKKTGDLVSFDKAIELESEAVKAYGQIVTAAGDIYNEHLAFGSNENLFPGHWAKEYKRLQDALERLRTERANASGRETGSREVKLSADKDLPDAKKVVVDHLQKAEPGKDLKVTAKAWDPSIKKVALRYRRVTQFEDYQSIEMVSESGSDTYEAVILGGFITPKYDIMYFIEVTDTQGNGRMIPDMENEMPYVIVRIKR